MSGIRGFCGTLGVVWANKGILREEWYTGILREECYKGILREEWYTGILREE